MRDAVPATAAEPATSTRAVGESKWRRLVRPLLRIPTPVLFVVTALIAGVVLWRQGSLGQMAHSLKAMSPREIAILLGLYAIGIVGLGVRWQALVKMAGGNPPLAISIEAFLTSVMVNYAAPIGLAVPTRAALAMRDLKLTPTQSGAVVAWEGSLDLLALVLISLAWLVTGGASSLPIPRIGAFLLIGIIVAVIGVVAAGITLTKTAIGQRVLSFVRRSLAMAGERPAPALVATAITAGYWAIQLVVMGILLRVFSLDPPLTLLLGLMGLPILIGMVSPVPGGAGIREALMTAAARLAGYPVAPVLLAAIAYRLALFAVTPLVWAVLRLTSLARSR
ncbi:MAG: lysylphosphatidylglycerol synthase transmembrane domain-containing protein [Thermomicrobiales bacterium]